MMKIKFLVFLILLGIQAEGFAANLVEVFQAAIYCDPIYQEAIAQRLSTKEGFPIQASAVLPQVNLAFNTAITRTGFSGTSFISDFRGEALSPRNITQKSYTLTLTATQTIVDFAQFARIAGAVATSRGADAILNAALQDLIVRVVKAYFTVLKDEENLIYTEATKIAYAEQLDQVNEEYKVGLKTLTDVYTAKASYDSAVADFIAAQTTLENDRENLRVITGRYYPHLARLSENFPLLTPKPANVDDWVRTALIQNWTIKAFQFEVQTAKQRVKEQVAGHLPTAQLQGTADRIYNFTINRYNTLNQRFGPGTQTDRSIGMNINVPIFSGGGVAARTNQAIFDLEATQQRLEQTVREALNNTRQNYLNVLTGVSQLRADQQAIRSAEMSLAGMEESYKVGTETLVNVLNQQQKVYQAQTSYASDRFDFMNAIFALKQAVGTLGFDDICAINSWLVDTPRPRIRYLSLRNVRIRREVDVEKMDLEKLPELKVSHNSKVKAKSHYAKAHVKKIHQEKLVKKKTFAKVQKKISVPKLHFAGPKMAMNPLSR